MQIPQNIINMLSAKGKGYIEAALKIAQGQTLVEEGTMELAALDGRKLTGTGHNAGGTDVLATVRDLAKPPAPRITPDMVLAALREGDKNTPELAKALGCSRNRAREVAAATEGVMNVGAGNKLRWSINTHAPTRKLNKRPMVLNKTTRRPLPTKGQRQAAAKAADPDQQRADENKIVEALKEKPGLTSGGLMKLLKRSFYPVDRAIKNLVKTGRLTPSTVKMPKTNRTLQTWVPVAHVA